MTALTFVNAFGQVIDIDKAKQSAPKKKRETPKAVSHHKGFRAIGFSISHIAAAQAEHEKRSAAEVSEGRDPLPPFDAEKYMRSRNGFPVRSKPYSMREAADVCASIARKEGWRSVSVVEVRREVRNERGELVTA